jgi:hypothetical protein
MLRCPWLPRRVVVGRLLLRCFCGSQSFDTDEQKRLAGGGLRRSRASAPASAARDASICSSRHSISGGAGPRRSAGFRPGTGSRPARRCRRRRCASSKSPFRDRAWAKQIGGVISPSDNHLGEGNTYRWSASVWKSSARSTHPSWFKASRKAAREVIPNFGNTRYRCVPTVRGDMYNC